MSTDASYDVAIERDVAWEMRDGVALYADVYRPVGDGPFGVVLARTPYSKAQSLLTTHAHPKWFARHGYIVAIQDVRGRYASEGEWYPFAYEEQDGYDSVEHAARLDGSNGRVGMYGTSYIGATQWLAAVAQPEHLVCISPGVTSSDYYDGWTYRGGALQQAFAETWAILLGQDVARRQGRDALEQTLIAAYEDMGARFNELPLKGFAVLEDVAPWFFDWLEHPTHDEYWKRWSVEGRYGQVQVPALHVGGWYDIFLDGTLRNFVAMRSEGGSERARSGQRLLVGPWHHVPWGQYVTGRDFGPDARSTMSAVQLRWFDHWLKDEPTGLDGEPPVRIFVMGENRWRDEQAWPLARASTVELFLHSGGTATSLNGDGELSTEPPGDEPADDFVYDPRNPVRSLGGRSCCRWQVAPMGPVDQRPVEMTNFVLVYTSAVLEQPLEVTGAVRVVLHASTTAADTDWTAKLVDVHPDGTAINVVDGIVRARYRESRERADPIEPDVVYEYAIDLGSTSNVFAAGHRIRLEVASSSFPAYDRNLNTGGELAAEPIAAALIAHQTVYHDRERPSRLVLPVV